MKTNVTRRLIGVAARLGAGAARRARAGALAATIGSSPWLAVAGAGALLLATVAATPARAEGDAIPGVSEDRVLFGQSAAFSGPAEALGRGMQLGILAAFEERNRAGGVHGRTLELVSLDDTYEPELAIANTRRLIEEDHVFALVGAVGTPTSNAAEPIASAAGVPYIGPFTGAEFLRSRSRPMVINVRASYFQETEEMVERLTTDLGVKRIAILYQDDTYGLAGFKGLSRALKRRKLDLAGVGTYPRNTTAVKTAVLDLSRSTPEAVVIIGAYRPVAEFIRWARLLGFNPIFINISFVGSNALAHALGTDGDGVLVTQVVPFPSDPSIPIVADYHRAIEALSPGAEPGFVSLEGYIVGRFAVEAVDRTGPDLTRNGFINAVTLTGVHDLGGFELEFGPIDNQGSDRVFLTEIGPDGRYRPIERLAMRE